MTNRLVVVGALVGLLIVGGTRPAEATLFTLESYSIQLHATEPDGLALFGDNLLATPASFELNAIGDAFVTRLFRVGTRESGLEPNDLTPRAARASFTFSQPLPGFGGGASGVSGALNYFNGFGHLVWDNPATLAFGSTGLLQVELSQVIFGMPGEALVDATFTLMRQDGAPAGVPEPSTLLLMGAGVATLVGRQYRRRSA